uniref:Protein kinase domain-containing protein n=1 Tax=Steinernema glaseri TaxID=37863 RepID=A0A1I7ZN98_9BILA
MRTENCDVAVKMLPEYADDLSKSEFLREIALMKNLGYHERLVNMLACVTESEPYCLVVEYCSDGDLLRFLRDRCEYMLRLDKIGIDYTNPEESSYDVDMVITLKQLLMFAVQISYGLDYLAQKKYVHRDVAARNVLVHDKNYAKIGDFGLCRFVYAEGANYVSQGGRLPIKWMSPEAIRDYEFTTKSDVYDMDMVITLKQLLMFAVQISYGLDYLAQKKYVHRDVAARNVLVHDKNYAKIGDFGLCRFVYAEGANYVSQGGRLPIKWMSPEAIRDYEFTTKSDVWSFGVLMFEIITLGGTPYPCVQPDDMYAYLDAGNRMEQPDNCPNDYYNVMMQCWNSDPNSRPEFSTIRQKLASQLEEVTDEYSYLKLDSQKDYYNVRTAIDTL